MSKPTSGLLAVHFAQTVSVRPRNSDLLLARMFGARAKAEANARLIVAAWNACVEINSDNPIAAAEAMPDLFETLKMALPYIESVAGRVDRSRKTLQAERDAETIRVVMKRATATD